MNGNIFARLSGTKRNLLALLASSAMLTAGCANMASTSPGSTGVSALNVSATLGGKVHGGNQPVGGAVVNLYFAAQSEYAAPTLAATTTSASDGTGSFTFVQNTTSTDSGADNTFSCPTGEGAPLVYVVAKGGNTLNNGVSGDNNSAAAFIGVYGLCGAGANFLDLSEVTTVATMAAVQQFFNPADYGISADGTGQEYAIISNVTNTIALLANVANGTAVASTVIPSSGTGVQGVSVTATPETSKLNTLANVLSACINNTSASATPCTTLFADAAPQSPSLTNKPAGTTFAPATDTVQAIYYILTNPTNASSSSSTNLSNIFTLAGGLGAPYQPSLATAPTDWTIAISYASTSTCGTNSGGFISQPFDVNVDASDNIWIANSQATKGNLAEISAAGVPATCVFFGGTSNGGGTIDSSGNVWFATTESNDIYRYNPTSGASLAFPTPATPLGVTADGLGNVYFTSSANTSLYEIPGAATATTIVPAVQISDVVGPNPIRLMPDNQGETTASNIWVSSGSGYVSRVSPGTAGPNVLGNFSTTTFSTGGKDVYGVAVTQNNDVVVSSDSTDNFVAYLSNANSYGVTWTSAAGLGGLNTPTALAVDGIANIWAPNNTNASLTLGSVSELTAAGSALSPSTGYQKSTSFLSAGRASVVDQAGNVWIVGDGTVASPSNYVTEIIGAGVPIYQPYAKGLAKGRFQTIP